MFKSMCAPDPHTNVWFLATKLEAHICLHYAVVLRFPFNGTKRPKTVQV